MNQVFRPVRIEFVATLLESADRAGFWKLLSGKNQGHIPTLVLKRHFFAKRTLSRHPAGIHTLRLFRKSTRNIEVLVKQRVDHATNLCLRKFLWLAGDTSNNSGHRWFGPLRFWGISRDCRVAVVQWCLMDVLTLG